MNISVATATFYFLPFDQALEIIAAAGFKDIELDLYWERGKFAIAQHLKGLQPRQVVEMINQAGLKVSSIHDAGGMSHDSNSIQGFIDPHLAEYLNQLRYAPGCIVFHTPHIEGLFDQTWWQIISEQVVQAAEKYQTNETTVTIENMPLIDGYYVPMTCPHELLTFVSGNGLAVTLDTTHYAQIGVNVVQAASMLREKIKSIHLSDYVDDKSHVFIGDGVLDFAELFRVLDLPALHSIVLECSMGFLGQNILAMTQAELKDRLTTARSRLQDWLRTSQQPIPTEAQHYSH